MGVYEQEASSSGIFEIIREDEAFTSKENSTSKRTIEELYSSKEDEVCLEASYEKYYYENLTILQEIVQNLC